MFYNMILRTVLARPIFHKQNTDAHAGHPGHLGGGIRGASQGVPGASGQLSESLRRSPCMKNQGFLL